VESTLSSRAGSHSRLLKQGSDIGAAVSADRASKLRLQIGQPQIIAPLIGIDDDRVSAFIVAAKDLQPARAGPARKALAGFLGAKERLGGRAVLALCRGRCAGTLAAAAFTPNDVPQAVTIPSDGSSPALRAAIDRLADAHAELQKAVEADYAANDLFEAWERSHPQPKSKKGKRRWIKQMAAYHREVTPAAWHALMDAEQAFAAAQTAVAAIPIAGAADLHAMAACSAIYDEIELNRQNRAPIARVVAQEYFRLGKAVQS